MPTSFEGEDILRRIARLYAAVGAISSVDLEDVTVRVFGLDSKGIPIFALNPQGDYSQADLEHAAASSIHAVANFFEQAKVVCRKLGIPEAEAFEVTKESLSLQILRDLDNQDKHPEGQINSSGVFPRLSDVRRSIRLGGSKEQPGVFQFTFGPGSDRISVSKQTQVDLVITGSVKNRKTGALLATLDFLLMDGCYQWERFLQHHQAYTSLGFMAVTEKLFGAN